MKGSLSAIDMNQVVLAGNFWREGTLLRVVSVLVILFGLFSAHLAVSAQDQQLGARTKSMGGSYTAFEDDPVSIWLNPAGIATQPDQFAVCYQTYTAYPVERSRGGIRKRPYTGLPRNGYCRPCDRSLLFRGGFPTGGPGKSNVCWDLLWASLPP